MPLAPPLHHIYLKTNDPYGELARNLTLFLKMSNVQLMPTPISADTVLIIFNEETHDRLIGITGNQATRQYNLVLIVTFGLTDSKGRTLLPPQTVRETRTLSITSGQVLAGSNEATTVYQQMRQAIVFDILNRLSSKHVTEILTKKLTQHESS